MAEGKTYVFFYKCISHRELLRRIREQSNFLLIDLIGNYQGNDIRIKGSTSIPYYDLIDRRREFRPYSEIILYCRNKTCNAARKRAVGLQLAGYERVLVYDAGLDDWVRHGLPVEKLP